LNSRGSFQSAWIAAPFAMVSSQLCLLFANEHGDIVKLQRVTKNIKVADEQHYRK
jgi:hypothetical protein